MATELKSALNEFVRFAQTLRGDEKSEAQTFLDHFFRALGHDGVIEAGATFEFRVAKKPGSPQLELITGNGAPSRAKGGKKFADLLWPDRVLIEMKSRGENLEKHYDQTFDYWTHIVPKRPPFVILCNFDEFWIYDFNTQLFDPVERLKLTDLPSSISAFNFLLPSAPPAPVNPNDIIDYVTLVWNGVRYGDRTLKFGDNGMDKLNVPPAGDRGALFYRDKTLMFSRLADGAFRFTVGDDRDRRSWERKSRRVGAVYRVGRRAWGLF